MNREEVKSIIVESINRVCGNDLDVEDLDERQHLSDLGMDSLDVMEMSIDLEIALVELKNQEEQQWVTLGGVIETYCRALNIQ